MEKEEETPKNVQLEFIKKLNEEKREENFLLSPIGLEMVLSLSASGAAGKTQEELLKSLNCEKIEDAIKMSEDIINALEKDKNNIKLANVILSRAKMVKSTFTNTVDKLKAKIEELKDVNCVNKWVNEKTNGKIPNIIDIIPEEIIMILLSASYFEANWKIQFKKFICIYKKYS